MKRKRDAEKHVPRNLVEEEEGSRLKDTELLHTVAERIPADI
jgi:hypothetical protein